MTPVTWENFSTYNTLKAQEEMKTSVKLREAMYHAIQQVSFFTYNVDTCMYMHTFTNTDMHTHTHTHTHTEDSCYLAIWHTPCIPQTNNDLETQWRATDYAFRRRIHEIEEAKNELEWQKKNVRINYLPTHQFVD